MATKKMYTAPRGLVSYGYRGSTHTGTVQGYVKHGATAASTIMSIRPSQHFAGESALIHRHADKIRPASKPILGHSHVHPKKK